MYSSNDIPGAMVKTQLLSIEHSEVLSYTAGGFIKNRNRAKL
jgi:hypothetical protein